MTTEVLTKLFSRDLNRLKNEITSYKNESNIWKVDKDIANSGGNLCIHIVGNLLHFIGATLGQTGYVRDRPAEFADKNISVDEMISRINKTIEVIKTTLANLKEDQLDKEYPLEVLGAKTSTRYFLIHLNGHLNYHLGQINYHRRLLE